MLFRSLPLRLTILTLLFCFLHGSNVFAQNVGDSSSVKVFNTDSIHLHSPKKATIFSAILPGLGQAYNRKYWKIPIIYGGFAFFGKNIYDNNSYYQAFKEAYHHKLLNDSTTPVNNYEIMFPVEKLKSLKDAYRRDRDFMIILTGFWYILNIVDASVDANLFYWEVDDNLSIRLQPEIINYSYAGRYHGFCLQLRF